MTSYYCLDNPSALHDALKHHFSKDFSEKRFEHYFSLMYSVYALPNIVLPFFGGLLIDRFGYRWMNMVFGLFLVLGHSIFAAGIQSQDMTVVLVGRTVFGFGGECIIVGLSALLSDWFGGSDEFAMVMGINLSLGRLGSVLNNVGSRAWYHSEGIEFAIWFGAIILSIALVCGGIFIFIDIYVESRIKESKENQGMDSTIEPKPDIKLSEALGFRFTYWLLVLSCIIIYGCIIPFNNVAGALIIEKFICHGRCCPENEPKCAAQQSAESDSSFVMGIPFVITAVMSPFMGAIVDHWGGNAVLILCSGFVLVIVHTILASSSAYAAMIVALVLLGLSYTVYAAALWPSVPCTVLRRQVGTAYGLMTSLQNVGLTLFPLCVGAIRAEAGSYTGVEIFFACLAGVGVGIGFWLLLHDQSEGGVINMSAKERESYIEENEAAEKGKRGENGEISNGDGNNSSSNSSSSDGNQRNNSSDDDNESDNDDDNTNRAERRRLTEGRNNSNSNRNNNSSDSSNKGNVSVVMDE